MCSILSCPPAQTSQALDQMTDLVGQPPQMVCRQWPCRPYPCTIAAGLLCPGPGFTTQRQSLLCASSSSLGGGGAALADGDCPWGLHTPTGTNTPYSTRVLQWLRVPSLRVAQAGRPVVITLPNSAAPERYTRASSSAGAAPFSLWASQPRPRGQQRFSGLEAAGTLHISPWTSGTWLTCCLLITLPHSIAPASYLHPGSGAHHFGRANYTNQSLLELGSASLWGRVWAGNAERQS